MDYNKSDAYTRGAFIKNLTWADLLVAIVIFCAIPIIVVLDFLIDGCISTPLGTGLSVCGSEAKENVINMVGLFVFVGLILGLKIIENKIGKKTSVVLIGLLVAAMAFLGPIRSWYKDKAAEALDKSGEIVLSSFVTAQNVFYAEYRKYTTDFNAMGFTLEPIESTYEVFVAKESVPSEYLQVLRQDEIPYVEDHSFRVLLALKNEHRKQVSFFIANEKRQIAILSVRVPYLEESN